MNGLALRKRRETVAEDRQNNHNCINIGLKIVCPIEYIKGDILFYLALPMDITYLVTDKNAFSLKTYVGMPFSPIDRLFRRHINKI
ncbi:hypothetical protein PPO22_12450 [Proteus mirabilis]|uniref:hypothetical protein n=1 Tax=Proteus mirabilis TaxID=584 RepID=UPI00234A78C4|nr:hypothetical protein [Proteus mirabilis]MDC5888358.1 hypothetical protein [Proteus mirabilis]MDC5905955.1 hypothetical protein [Proteus mirabilis]MDC5923607.1 hypothetical protein [Proteus mirabilis]MDC5934136.1 hypothetical protein [Proteus mirabilis]MDC5939073.1 hypothetical protein [Proteus mirabilis]